MNYAYREAVRNDRVDSTDLGDHATLTHRLRDGLDAYAAALAAVDGKTFELRWLRHELQTLSPAADGCSIVVSSQSICAMLSPPTGAARTAGTLLLQVQLARASLRCVFSEAEAATIAAACVRLLPSCEKVCGSAVAAGLAVAPRLLAA